MIEKKQFYDKVDLRLKRAENKSFVKLLEKYPPPEGTRKMTDEDCPSDEENATVEDEHRNIGGYLENNLRLKATLKQYLMTTKLGL
jgi:hypothetical protein